ncbi:globin 1 [Calliopsis andreniformis]|uniref:globin 1 n=1 Tax=Calliopsis andreniformis TaxID=337506 RepID=UPI003FCD90A3
MGSIFSYVFGYPDDNVVDPKLGLTGREKRFVQQTWNILRANSIETGVAIMTSYFKKYPQYHQVFTAFKDIPVDELSTNKKFQAHCQNIMTTLNNAFDALNDIDLMEAVLHTVGERHGRRGQNRQQFIDLKGVIMEVMKCSLKSKFSPEVEAAWDKTIDLAFSKIFEEMEKNG